MADDLIAELCALGQHMADGIDESYDYACICSHDENGCRHCSTHEQAISAFRLRVTDLINAHEALQSSGKSVG